MMPLKTRMDGNSGSPARGEPENMIGGVTRCPRGERRAPFRFTDQIFGMYVY